MEKQRLARLAGVIVACGCLALASSQAAAPRERHGPGSAAPNGRKVRLSVWPIPAASGRAVNIDFVAPIQATGVAPTDLRVEVYNLVGRRIDVVPATTAKAERGLITVTWDGRGDGGSAALPGVYVVRAVAPSIGFRSERRLVVR